MDRITVIPSFAAAQTLDDLKRMLVQNWSEMANLVNNCFTLYVQSTMPTIPNNTTSLWQDTTNTPTFEYYLVSNFGGTHQLVQLTAALPVDPLHKHSKLWASDGDPVCVTVDATGNASIDGTTTLSDLTTAGFVKNNASGVLSGGNAITAEFQKARAYRSSALALTGGQYNKINIGAYTFAVPEAIVDTTNFRIKPTLAGYYQVSGQVTITDLADNDTMVVSIYKTNTQYTVGNILRNDAGATAKMAGVVSDIVYLDGTNDYVELYCYTSVNCNLDISGALQNYLSVVGPF